MAPEVIGFTLSKASDLENVRNLLKHLDKEGLKSLLDEIAAEIKVFTMTGEDMIVAFLDELETEVILEYWSRASLIGNISGTNKRENK